MITLLLLLHSLLRCEEFRNLLHSKEYIILQNYSPIEIDLVTFIQAQGLKVGHCNVLQVLKAVTCKSFGYLYSIS